jgi:hypothetical protein
MDLREPPQRPMWLRRARARASLERASGRGQRLRSLLHSLSHVGPLRQRCHAQAEQGWQTAFVIEAGLPV